MKKTPLITKSKDTITEENDDFTTIIEHTTKDMHPIRRLIKLGINFRKAKVQII